MNYRGSTGFGDANVRSLIGHAGNYDVLDCYLALNTLIDKDKRLTYDISGRDVLESDRHMLFLYGGSFGGFTVGHLAGLYPELFRAMVVRNPLIDLATKGHYADNSDG